MVSEVFIKMVTCEQARRGFHKEWVETLSTTIAAFTISKKTFLNSTSISLPFKFLEYTDA